LTADLSDLKVKYDKLENMFNEKSVEFEKTKESLDSELKNRKDFNKVKDILEKELKDSKDKARSTQAHLSEAQSEADSHKKRTEQLDEKAANLEKDLLKKEDKISALMQKEQNSVNPSANSTPAADQELKQGEEAESTPPADQPNTDDSSAESNIEPSKTEEPTQTIPASNQTHLQFEPKSQEEAPSQTEENSLQPEKNDKPSMQEGNKIEAANNQPEEDQFLKLQPDIISNKPEKEEPTVSKDQTTDTDGFKPDLSIENNDIKPKTESEKEPPGNSSDNKKPE